MLKINSIKKPPSLLKVVNGYCSAFKIIRQAYQ